MASPWHPARRALITLIAALVLCLTHATKVADAGGLLLGENGTQAMGRSGAFVAKADDPSAVIHNPAGLARAKRIETVVSVSLIRRNISFERLGQYEPEQVGATQQPAYIGEQFPVVNSEGSFFPIPFLAIAIPINRLTLGGAIYAPHIAGGSGNFPEMVRSNGGTMAPAPQRYDVTTSTSLAVIPTVAAAYQITDNFSAGLRMSAAYVSTKTRAYAQALPNDQEQPGLDTVIDVEAVDPFSFGFGFGLQYQLENVELGLNYSSAIKSYLRGNANIQLGETVTQLLPGTTIEVLPVNDADALCGTGGQRGAIRACASNVFPQSAMLGARYVARDKSGNEVADLEFDIGWEDWSAASEQVVVLDGMISLTNDAIGEQRSDSGLQDSFTFRLGGSRNFLAGSALLSVRGGLSYDTPTAPVSWTRLSADGAAHFMLTSGLGVEFGRFRMDFAAAWANSPTRYVRDVPIDRSGGSTERVQPDVPAAGGGDNAAPNPYNAGTYRRSYLIGNLGVTFMF